jgi:tRNA (guanine-N7-)-methyltransferase
LKQETKKAPPILTEDPRAFFGRRTGKGLRAGRRNLIEKNLPRLAISLPETGLLAPASLFDRPRRICLEIGFGGGEHLARLAGEHPNDAFIGCEVYSGGIAKMLHAIASDGLSNIALYADDAIKLLLVLEPQSLDEIYLLYPDPWPKTRHRKRRFVSPRTVAQLARTLKPGGQLLFATDIKPYASWTLDHVARSDAFDLAPGARQTAHMPFAGWQPTRYENKARTEGRVQSLYYTFSRNHQPPTAGPAE